MKKETIIVAIILIGWSAILPLSTYAQNDFVNGVQKAYNAGTGAGLFKGDLASLIGNILWYITGIAAMVALAAIIFGGARYILSFGNESKTEEAKHIILYAIIGLLVMGGAFIILNIIKGIIGA